MVTGRGINGYFSSLQAQVPYFGGYQSVFVHPVRQRKAPVSGGRCCQFTALRCFLRRTWLIPKGFRANAQFVFTANAIVTSGCRGDRVAFAYVIRYCLGLFRFFHVQFKEGCFQFQPIFIGRFTAFNVRCLYYISCFVLGALRRNDCFCYR